MAESLVERLIRATDKGPHGDWPPYPSLLLEAADAIEERDRRIRELEQDARRYQLLRTRWVRAYNHDDRSDKGAEFIGDKHRLDAQLDAALLAEDAHG